MSINITMHVTPGEDFHDVRSAVIASCGDDTVVFSDVMTSTTAEADLIMVRDDQEKPILIDRKFVRYATPAESGFAVNAAVAKDYISLPTVQGIAAFGAFLADKTDRLNRLKKANPKKGSPHNGLSVGKGFRATAWELHYPALDRHLPKLADKLSKRSARTLARHKDGYHPMEPVTKDGSIYDDLVTNADVHAAKLKSLENEFADAGVTIDPTNMSYAQLNIGLPFPGTYNRREKGYVDPSPTSDAVLDAVIYAHVKGLCSAYNELGEDGFTKLTTRATAKVGSYQGWPTETTDISVCSTMWGWMARQEDGLFAGLQLPALGVIGFRSQGGKGKRRPTFLLQRAGEIVSSMSLDAEDFASHPNGTLAATSGVNGARIRHIFNESPILNHSTMPVASYISDTKGPHYKEIFNPTVANIFQRVPDAPGWKEMWADALTIPHFRENVKDKSLLDLEVLLDWLRKYENCERPYSGDIGNFDGNTTWPLAKRVMDRMCSVNVVEAVSKMWNSDLIGVYRNENDEDVFYYIDRSDGKSMFDMLCSGMGVTSVLGRTIVPATTLAAYCKVFGLDPKIFYGSKAYGKERTSLIGLMMASAGDDHSIFFQLASLFTGKLVAECRDMYADYMANEEKTYTFEPEFPQMNAGIVLHTDDNGVLFATSLSSGRMTGNNLNNERPRSALGLRSSLEIYTENAFETPEEEPTLKLAELIRDDVYGFGSDFLDECVAEDEVALEELAELGGSPVELIAAIMDVPQSHLDWKYSYDELLAAGVPEDLLNQYKRPIPSLLTQNPFTFFNEQTIKEFAND